jgi:hypothetical protein
MAAIRLHRVFAFLLLALARSQAMTSSQHRLMPMDMMWGDGLAQLSTIAMTHSTSLVRQASTAPCCLSSPVVGQNTREIPCIAPQKQQEAPEGRE